MMSGKWGKEPFDLRLTVLRLIRTLPGILAVTLAGTILFGGGYILKNTVLRGERSYGVVNTFLVEYADENFAVNLKYINESSWNLWMQSDVLRELVSEHLDDAHRELAAKDLGSMLKVTVPSDLRVAQIMAVSGDPGEAEALLAAVSAALTEDFPKVMKDVRSISLTDREEAVELRPDVRPLRACILAAVMSAFFAVLCFLIRELTYEKIWLPTSLTDRYGLKSLGRMGTVEFENNLKYFFQNKQRIGVCFESNPSKKDKKASKESDRQEWEALQKDLTASRGASDYQFLPVPNPLTDPAGAASLREMDGVLLVVRSGEDTRHLEYILDYLRGQDVQVTAAFLWREDSWLVRNYYRFGKGME